MKYEFVHLLDAWFYAYIAETLVLIDNKQLVFSVYASMDNCIAVKINNYYYYKTLTEVHNPATILSSSVRCYRLIKALKFLEENE